MLISQHCSLCLRSLRYCWNWLGKGMLYSEFAAISRTPSRNFTQFLQNFMQFWLYHPFLANFNMLGIKMHVLELRNSLVILSKNFTRMFTQFSCNFGYFSQFWANFYMLGIKMHVLELRNSLVILLKNFTHVFTQFHAISCNFHAILAISAIFGPISTCWVSKCMYLS